MPLLRPSAPSQSETCACLSVPWPCSSMPFSASAPLFFAVLCLCNALPCLAMLRLCRAGLCDSRPCLCYAILVCAVPLPSGSELCPRESMPPIQCNQRRCWVTHNSAFATQCLHLHGFALSTTLCLGESGHWFALTAQSLTQLSAT